MKDLKTILLIILAFLLFTVVTSALNFSLNLIALFFIIGNVLMLFATFIILKYGNPSTKKFDEGEWYEDVDRK